MQRIDDPDSVVVDALVQSMSTNASWTPRLGIVADAVDQKEALGAGRER